MSESLRATAVQISEEAISAEESSHRLSPDIAQTLGEILTPDETGDVRFGAQNEILRLSQIEALTAIQRCFAEGISLSHIVKPGGAGKTRDAIIAAYALHAHEKNTLFIVPSQQAVRDFAGKTGALCPDLDVGTIYQIEKRVGRITFCTYASLLRYILGKDAEVEARAFENAQMDDSQNSPLQASRPTESQRFSINPADYDLVIWDENHQYLTPSAQKLVSNFEHATNIGLTATPRYYEGKEVGNVFGPNIYNLDLETAVERGEISDYRNLLITTDIVTGLELSSPDQEESAEVARAIDIPNRNRIFQDLYRNTTINVEGETYTLAGEPAIVFGASIDHVHDIAQAFNDALMPALKNDEEFRSLLRSKNIDPDTVEHIAAPIHSGNSKKSEGMSLHARNALTDRYHQRKVLVLVATSVLQQSFDSLITSVVIDAVPRQTFVGVGQAGMRALRRSPEKKMAFIINTCDADHSSLTFHDFQAARGTEEGVIVGISHKGTGKRKNTSDDASNRKFAKYDVTYGTSLVDLAERRKAHAGRLYRSDYETSSRHLTSLGFQKVNQLIRDMATGNKEAVGTFLEVIQPWIARTRELIEPQVFEDDWRDDEMMENVVVDILIPLLRAVQEGNIPSWARFTSRFQQDLRRQCERIQRKNLPTVSLEERVDNTHPESHLHETDPEELIAIREPAKIPLRETIRASDDSDEEYPGEEIDREALRPRIEKVLKTLPEREQDVLKLRFYLDGGEEHSLKKTGEVLKVGPERVRQIESKAVRKLQQPSRSQELIAFAPDERPLALLEQREAAEAALERALEERNQLHEQRIRNNQILWEIESDLVRQKQIILGVFSNNNPFIISRIVAGSRIPIPVIQALSDIEWTRIHLLTDALDDRVLMQIRHALELINVSRENIAAFNGAVRELKKLMDTFTKMGGKPVLPDELKTRLPSENDSPSDIVNFGSRLIHEVLKHRV